MTNAPILIKLVLAHNAKRWVRALLGILGIAVSVCLVVWVIRGYDVVAQGPAEPTASQVGRFDVVVAPPNPRMLPGSKGKGKSRHARPMDARPKYVNPQLIEELRKDPLVAEVVPTVRTRVRVVHPQPAMRMGPFGGGMLIGTVDEAPPVALEQGSWLQAAQKGVAVISTGFGKRYALELGDALTVGGVGGEVQLKIVGILRTGSGGRMPFFSPNMGDIYVTPTIAEQLNGFSERSNVVNLILKDSETTDEFVRTWTQGTLGADPPVTFRSLRQKDDDPMGGRMLGMIKVQAQNATVLAFLAAFFIIFATLNAGVRERLRELASLRAIAMSRSQLATMIFFEAFLLALLGWAVGLLLAWGLLGLGNALAVYLRFFQAGAFVDSPLGWASVFISGSCALVGSLAAAVLPAWQAAKLKPIDILSGLNEGRTTKFPRLMVVTGSVLVVANPIAVIVANVEPFKTFFSKTYKMGFGPPLLASAALIVGLALVTPVFVCLVEAAFGPVLAWLLRLDRRFLRQQLSGNLWRTVGTTISLSAGLTLFVTALVWGYSMLVPYTPDESLPRMLVSILPAGIPESDIDAVCKTPGVKAGECLGMTVEQPRLTEKMLSSEPFSSVEPSQQHLLFMGVDPRRSFSGPNSVFKFDFLQGDKKSAAHKLAAGRYCLVPDHFHTQTGLEVGDKFSVEVPNLKGKSVEYEIAGVVYIPGWNWFTKFSEIRRRSGRALAVVFADYNQVKADFKIDRISYFWMNVDQRVGFEEMEKRLVPLANRHAGVRVDVPGIGEAAVSKQYVRITERADLTARLFRRADDVIWSLTRFPLLALIIASLALFNTVFASVRSRFWQLGILRGVGLTRWQLFRLIISESLMIFAAAGALSLGSGILLAWSGTRICTYFFYFAGRTPPLVLPWGGLALGLGIAFGFCLLAGLIPAWQVVRKEPLGFIQAGRLSY